MSWTGYSSPEGTVAEQDRLGRREEWIVRIEALVDSSTQLREPFGIVGPVKNRDSPAFALEGADLVGETPSRQVPGVQIARPNVLRKLQEVERVFEEMIAVVDQMQHYAV